MKKIRMILWIASALLAAGFATQPARAKDRQPLPEAMPAKAGGLAATGRLAATDRLNLAISLPLRQKEALARFLNELYDPASANYRRFLTPEQFAERFGPAKEDYQVLVEFARANGFTVTAEHPNRTLLDVNGSVADIEKALHTTLRVYPHPTEARTFYAPESRAVHRHQCGGPGHQRPEQLSPATSQELARHSRR